MIIHSKKPQMMKTKAVKKNSSGFTLIELLVVIGIITLISSVILSSLTQAKAQANNTKQIADYRVILGALTQLKQENGYYPSNGTDNTFTCIGDYSNGCKQTGLTVNNNASVDNLLKKYLSSYNFIDKTITIADPDLGIVKEYNGFVLSCKQGAPLCTKATLLFPALKNRNSCPQIMSDISSSDFFNNGTLDYTWCQVDLN